MKPSVSISGAANSVDWFGSGSGGQVGGTASTVGGSGSCLFKPLETEVLARHVRRARSAIVRAIPTPNSQEKRRRTPARCADGRLPPSWQGGRPRMLKSPHARTSHRGWRPRRRNLKPGRVPTGLVPSVRQVPVHHQSRLKKRRPRPELHRIAIAMIPT